MSNFAWRPGRSGINPPLEGVVMTTTSTTPAATSIDVPRTPARSTRTLLTAGTLAGPLFAVLATGQVLLRDGFDLRRHPLSLLATGGPGFVQMANFVLAGIGVLCLSVAVRRTITDGVGRRWLAPLIAVFGLGLVASGVFVMDPENVSDGPFAELKEVLASYAVIDCSGYDRAVAIARQVVAAIGDTVEIRPIMGEDFGESTAQT
jgi:hypothetical protein